MQPIANVPVVIFQFAMSPYDEWHALAWAGALVLTAFVLLLNILVRFSRGKDSNDERYCTGASHRRRRTVIRRSAGRAIIRDLNFYYGKGHALKTSTWMSRASASPRSSDHRAAASPPCCGRSIASMSSIPSNMRRRDRVSTVAMSWTGGIPCRIFAGLSAWFSRSRPLSDRRSGQRRLRFVLLRTAVEVGNERPDRGRP